MLEENKTPNDPRSPDEIVEDIKRADEYAPKGTLKHYLLSRGFFPNNESDAEAILDGIISENEQLRRSY